MRILHVAPSYKPAYHYGGPTISVSRLAEAQSVAGADVTVYTTTANGETDLPEASERPLELDGVAVWYFRRWTGDHGHFSPALLWRLWKTIHQFDIVHIHSWWNWVVFGAIMITRIQRPITVVSPHGMLSPYSLRNRWRHLFQQLVGNRLLRYTTLHGTSRLEVRELQALVPGVPTAMVHNLVVLPSSEHLYERSGAGTVRLLFISRVHPKKGLDLLLEALPGLTGDWELYVAGDGPADYTRKIRSKAKRLGLTDRIKWIGWVDATEKWPLITGSDLMVLPSFNENFAIVVVEALALGLPVLVSDQVGLFDYVRLQNFGWVSPRTITDLRTTLQEAIDDEHKRQWIRELAPEQIRIDFDPKQLVARYFDLYKQLIGAA